MSDDIVKRLCSSKCLQPADVEALCDEAVATIRRLRADRDMDLSPWTTTMVLADYGLPASVIDWVLEGGS